MRRRRSSSASSTNTICVMRTSTTPGVVRSKSAGFRAIQRGPVSLVRMREGEVAL